MNKIPLSYQQKEYILYALNNLIYHYGEDSCIKLSINFNNFGKDTAVFSGTFIQFIKNNINGEDKYDFRFRINLNQEFTELLERLLAMYLNEYPEEESEDIMFTLKDWLEMFRAYC